MIFTDRKITIRNGKSTINEPVILYRGDYEVSIKFTIMESKFRFKSGVNLVDSEKASHGQLAILTPYGGNVFSEIVKCEDGTVTFTLTKEMIDQLEEVGLYSFQIRLFDYYRESRVSIPPVEFGIEVREPVASEDHDNEVNNAIVGYSIAKIADGLNEDVPNTFDDNGNYNKTDWETGDRISEGKLNKIEDAIDKLNQNEKKDVATLDKKVNNNYNVLNSTKADKNEIFSMANMGQDIKEAMTGGSVAVVGKNTILNENIVAGQISYDKTDFVVTGKNLFNYKTTSNENYWKAWNSGEVGSNEYTIGWCYSDYIKVKPNSQLVINDALNSVLFYDANKQYKSGITSGQMMPFSFTIPSDCEYIVINLVSYDKRDTIQLEYGTVPTEFESYGIDIPSLLIREHIDDIEQDVIDTNSRIDDIKSDIDGNTNRLNDLPEMIYGKNMFNKFTVSEMGWWVNWTNGKIESFAAISECQHSDFIPIDGVTPICVSGERYTLAWYDIDKKFISGIERIPETGITPPNNARYIIVNFHYYAIEMMQVEYGTAPTNYEPYNFDMIGLKANEDVATLNDEMNLMAKDVDRHEDIINNISSYGKLEVNYGERTTPRAASSTFTGWGIQFSKSVFTGEKLTYFSVSLTAYDNSTDKNVIGDVPVSLLLVNATPREGSIRHDTIEVLSRAILKESGTVEFKLNKPVSELPDNFILGVRATAQCNLLFWNAKSNGTYPLDSSAISVYSTGILETGEWMVSSSVYYVQSDFKVGTDVGIAMSSHKHDIEDIEGLDDLVLSKVKLSLPDKYELIVGDTFELFYKGILLTNNPYNYNIQIQCNKGAYYSRKYMFTPTASDVGTHNMTILVYDDNETLLDFKTVKLVVKNKAVSPSTIKNVLCVGDSLTNGGIWPREAYRRLAESGGTPAGDGLSNINFIGTCKNGPIGFEGYGGWSYTTYNTNSITQQQYWIMTTANKPLTYQKSVWQDSNGVQWVLETIQSNRIKIYRNVYGTQLPPASGSLTWVSGGDGSANDTIAYTSYEDEATNPFWNNVSDKVDFGHYVNKLGVSSIDHCYVLLGWNQTGQSENDFKEGARTFINNLRASFPNCKIVLMGLQVPSLDGFGSNYGCSWNFYDKLKVVFNMNKWNYEIAKEFDNMDFINIAGQFDTENNMPTSTRPVNVRNSKTEVYGTNGVHPDGNGQLQIADAVYRHLSQNL